MDTAFKQDNKGFTLLELIISFAILTFVIAAIVGLMAVGMRFFRTTSSNIGLQYEYQVVMTSLREYIVDCNAGIAYDETDDALYIVYKEDLGDVDGDGIDDYDYTIHIYIFDGVQSLFYMEVTHAAMNTLEDPADVLSGAQSLVSQRINLFDTEVNQDAVTGQVSVVTDMQFFSPDRQYRAAQTVSLRNRVVAGDTTTSPITIYDSYTELRDAILS